MPLLKSRPGKAPRAASVSAGLSVPAISTTEARRSSRLVMCLSGPLDASSASRTPSSIVATTRTSPAPTQRSTASRRSPPRNRSTPSSHSTVPCSPLGRRWSAAISRPRLSSSSGTRSLARPTLWLTASKAERDLPLPPGPTTTTYPGRSSALLSSSSASRPTYVLPFGGNAPSLNGRPSPPTAAATRRARRRAPALAPVRRRAAGRWRWRALRRGPRVLRGRRRARSSASAGRRRSVHRARR